MQTETRKDRFEQQSPGRDTYNSDYEEKDSRDLSNVQIAQVWREIEANIAKYKKDSQFSYK